mgnify:CR=1 FL=1
MTKSTKIICGIMAALAILFVTLQAMAAFHRTTGTITMVDIHNTHTRTIYIEDSYD